LVSFESVGERRAVQRSARKLVRGIRRSNKEILAMPFGRVISDSVEVLTLAASEVLATLGKSFLEGRIRHEAQCRA